MKKKVEGLTFPKEQRQLYLVKFKGSETQEIIPVTQMGRPRGEFAPRLGHIEDSGGSSPAVTPCIRQGGAQRRVETFEGNRWEGTLNAFFQFFSPTLGQDEENVGNRGKGRGRMVLRNEMLLHGK